MKRTHPHTHKNGFSEKYSHMQNKKINEQKINTKKDPYLCILANKSYLLQTFFFFLKPTSTIWGRKIPHTEDTDSLGVCG